MNGSGEKTRRPGHEIGQGRCVITSFPVYFYRCDQYDVHQEIETNVKDFGRENSVDDLHLNTAQ